MSIISPFVAKLIQTANAEHARYSGIDESDEPLHSRINKYCIDIGEPPPQNITEFAWSATFISWCVKTAGATADEFDFSTAHRVFVKAAIENAEAAKGVFRARRIGTYAPKIGDIIAFNREGGDVTYDEAKTNNGYPSHSIIVVDFEQSGGSRYAVGIGGNESDSVRRSRVQLDASGQVRQRSSNPFICVIENLKEDAGPEDETNAIPATYDLPPAGAGCIVAQRAPAGSSNTHGPVVEALQIALGQTGFSTAIDGDFGNDTLVALNAWKRSVGLTEGAEVTAAHWSALTGSQPPSIFDICLQLTASFEGTGFTGAVGNFDGAGVTFGIIGFTARNGELGRLITAVKQREPSLVAQCFGDLTADLESGLLAPTESGRIAFANSISIPSNPYNLQPAWKQAFKRFGSEAVVKEVQLARAYDVYWKKAHDIFKAYGLSDAQDAALAFDIAVQNGSVKPNADAVIRARLPGITNPEERRLVISRAVRDASNPQWQADVWSRKAAIAQASGQVHGARYTLTSWGLSGRSLSMSDLAQPTSLRFGVANVASRPRPAIEAPRPDTASTRIEEKVAMPTDTLSFGAIGQNVTILQIQLNKLGYSVGTADGEFGAYTRAAVLAFQADNGLPTTGVVDGATWAALATARQRGTPFGPPAGGTDPAQAALVLQQLLAAIRAAQGDAIKPTDGAAGTPALSPKDKDLTSTIQQIIELMRVVKPPQAGTGGGAAKTPDELDKIIRIIQSITNPNATDPDPLGQVNGALGETIGKMLDGKKSAIGIIGALLTSLLSGVPDGSGLGQVLSTITPAAGLSQFAMPVFLALSAWGALGKFEKWSQGTAPPPSP